MTPTAMTLRTPAKNLVMMPSARDPTKRDAMRISPPNVRFVAGVSSNGHTVAYNDLRIGCAN
jgi:hypothetical protein